MPYDQLLRDVRNDWESFWIKRGIFDFKHLGSYVRNFGIFVEIMQNHFGVNTSSLRSLEVGAGRGTISHYLKSFGVSPVCLDLQKRLHYPDLDFVEGDALNLPFEKGSFDLVFSYGLLEHFNTEDQIKALDQMMTATKSGGLNIHYIVPMKLTNVFEDNNVYRDCCRLLRDNFEMQWVYPVFQSMQWKTNRWWGKGAFFSLKRRIYNGK